MSKESQRLIIEIAFLTVCFLSSCAFALLIIDISEVLAQGNPVPSSTKQPTSLSGFMMKDIITLVISIFAIVVPLFAVGVVGFFGLKADLRVIQVELRYLNARFEQSEKRTDSIENRIGMIETKIDDRFEAINTKIDDRIGAVETKIHSFEVLQAEVLGELRLLHEKIDRLGQG